MGFGKRERPSAGEKGPERWKGWRWKTRPAGRRDFDHSRVCIEIVQALHPPLPEESDRIPDCLVLSCMCVEDIINEKSLMVGCDAPGSAAGAAAFADVQPVTQSL